MKKYLITAVIAAAFAIACLAGCVASDNPGTSSASSDANAGSSSAKLKVVASFYPMADFAQKIGGNRVEVTNLVPAGTEPHDWEPSTADMQTLEAANVFVYNGAGMEQWADKVLSTLSNKNLVTVKASEGVELHKAADAEEGEYDPHVWLSPKNAKIEMKNICDALVSADPSGKDTYEANYQTYAAQLDALDKEYQEGLSGLPNKSIVVSHQAFGYLCSDYGLEQVAIEGLDAEAEPDAKTMAEIVDFAKKNNVKVIFSEDLVSPKVAEQIASETGATCEVLNPLEGLTDEQLSQGADYFSVMRDNRAKLEEALK